MDSCRFNETLECGADSIKVGWHADHADCITFSPRR
ncbi:MAG TPA: hypothetical protein PKM41_04785 [Deltaproteobacteria bacterium]|nr:hypothetical protein [Deltaproteobacteria bacterium]HOI05524.1 hypothetical protein [Deltaproteobacteria bacterium]